MIPNENWNVIKEDRCKLGRFEIIYETIERQENDIGYYSYVVFGKNGICVLPVLQDGKIVLIKQYRRAIDRWEYEVPAGLIDENEEPEKTAVRELQEETGYITDRLIPCGSMYPSPGSTTEKQFLFIAECSQKTEAKPDKSEKITVHAVSNDELIDLLNRNEIMHGAALILINRYLRMLTENSRLRN